MDWLRQKARIALALVAVLSLVALAACGSNDSESAGSTATTAGGTTARTIESELLPPTPEADGADVAAAQQYVLDNMGTPSFAAPGDAFDIRTVEKPVWLLQPVASAPPVPQVTDGFIEAAKAAGVPYHVCPAGGTPDGNALCLRQAAQAGAGSAILWSVPLARIAAPLEAAREAGVKVVSANGALRIGEDVPEQVDAEVSHDYYGTGVLNAAYAIAARGGSLDALCIDVPDFYVGTAVCQGFTDTVERYCPDCRVKTVDVTVAGALTQAPAVTNQAVLSDPKLNFVIPAFDYLNPVVDRQLRSLGKTIDDVMVGGENGSIGPLQAIKNRDFEVANAGQSAYWWGWSFFDAGARAQVDALGDKAVLTTPNKLFTTESLAGYDGKLTYDDADELYGLGDGSVYRDGYQNLWNGS